MDQFNGGGSTVAARIAAYECARVFERIGRNRDRARKRGIAKFETRRWPGIAADARALLDVGTLATVDEARLERLLGREAAHRVEMQQRRRSVDDPDDPKPPRHDPGIGF